MDEWIKIIIVYGVTVGLTTSAMILNDYFKHKLTYETGFVLIAIFLGWIIIPVIMIADLSSYIKDKSNDRLIKHNKRRN